MNFRWLISVVVFLAFSHALWAQEASSIDPARYAPQQVTFILKNKGVFGGDLKLQGVIYTPPKRSGPTPLVILAHGSNADEAIRKQFKTSSYWNPARYFLNRGFSVLYFLRPSYGQSEGPYLEANDSCQNPNYGPGFENLADTMMSAYDFAQTLPGLDMQRVLFVGHSAGGAAAIAAAARQPKGVVAYINFAGGKGGSPDTPYKPCRADLVGKLFADYAKATGMPALWVYAPNDLYFGGDVSPEWHRQTAAAGGKAILIMTAKAKVDREGHDIMQNQLPLWIPAVDDFLKIQGFSWTP